MERLFREWEEVLDDDRGNVVQLPTHRLEMGHGDCHECDVSVGCKCRLPDSRHWCKRHRQLEMG